MEIQNHTKNQQTDSKTNQKVHTGFKRNQASHNSPDKKILEQKKYGNKLNKMFEHLAYQELDAD